MPRRLTQAEIRSRVLAGELRVLQAEVTRVGRRKGLLREESRAKKDSGSLAKSIDVLARDGDPNAPRFVLAHAELLAELTEAGEPIPSRFDLNPDLKFETSTPRGRRGNPRHTQPWTRRLPDAIQAVGPRPEAVADWLRSEGWRVRLDAVQFALREIESLRSEIRSMIKAVFKFVATNLAQLNRQAAEGRKFDVFDEGLRNHLSGELEEVVVNTAMLRREADPRSIAESKSIREAAIRIETREQLARREKNPTN
jgi:hypothetical protein